MAKTYGVIRFEAVLEKFDGRFAWTYVEVPFDVQKRFGRKGVVRVKGTINKVPMDRALMPRKSGLHLIIIGADLRKKAKVNVGEKALVEVWLNPWPDELELPEELQGTLDFLPDFKAGWAKLTPGMKRSMLIWINSGKASATRANRVADLLRRFEEHTPPFSRSRARR